MDEITQIAPISRDARRIGLVPLKFLDAESVVGGQPIQAPPPARLAADHRRLHDQLFPLPRRSQRAGDDGVIVGIDLRVGGQTDWCVVAPSKLLPYLWDLSEREIFVESLRRQTVDRARQQRDEGAARRVGAPGTAIEVRRHIAARARMLEEPEVLFRRSQKDRHLVEGHAPRRLVENPPHDFDRLASFARRRKQRDVAGALAFRRPFGFEHEPSQVEQIRSGFRVILERVDRSPEGGQRVEREPIAVGHRRERIRRLVDQRGDELLLGARIERDVEQQDRQPRPAHVTGPAGIGRELEQSGAIGDRGRRELRFEARQEGGDVDGPRIKNQGRRSDAGEPQLVQRTCESLRKSGQRRDRREVRELARADRLEDRARGNRFGAGVGAAGPARAFNPGGRRLRRQLGQAESGEAEGRAGAARDRACEIVRGAARCTDDDELRGGRASGEKGAGGVQPRRRR